MIVYDNIGRKLTIKSWLCRSVNNASDNLIVILLVLFTMVSHLTLGRPLWRPLLNAAPNLIPDYSKRLLCRHGLTWTESDAKQRINLLLIAIICYMIDIRSCQINFDYAIWKRLLLAIRPTIVFYLLMLEFCINIIMISDKFDWMIVMKILRVSACFFFC